MKSTLTVLALALLTSCSGGSGPIRTAEPENPSFTKYPALEPLSGLTNPTLAYGLDGTRDWMSSIIYLDVMKIARPLFGHIKGKWGGITNKELKDGGYLDENGWPTSIPSNASSVGTVFAWGNSAFGQLASKVGEYVLTYEGIGTISIGGTSTVSSEPGKIVINIDDTVGNWWFYIKDTDTSDHIRNIKIIKKTDIDLYNSGEIFNPLWINNIQNARQLRYMDAFATNNSKEQLWTERNTYDSPTWGVMPIEVAVRLANKTGTDPWLNIPFNADNDYITNMAKYVEENLDKRLVATVELSNEVWNWAFRQTHESHDAGIAEWNLDPNNGGAAWLNYYGKRSFEVMKIWTEVYGSETSSRLNRVVSTQTVSPYRSEQILLAPMWLEADPTNYVPPHTYFDSLGVTTYFGGSIVRDVIDRTNLFEVMLDPTIDEFDWHAEYIRSGADITLYDIMQYIRNQKVMANKYNLNLIAYEGGQHVHHSAFIQIPTDELLKLQDHQISFVRSQQMADLYQEVWDVWASIGDGPFMQFTAHGSPGKSGSWGLRASLTDTSPRLDLLENLNRDTSPWWGVSGGERYQQGITGDGLVGTAEEDHLVGTFGDDIFYTGPGNDGINGKEGTDTALFKGNSAEYTYTPYKNGYKVVGPEGTDYLYSVEVIQFKDKKITIGN